jgi:hypothetical protein
MGVIVVLLAFLAGPVVAQEPERAAKRATASVATVQAVDTRFSKAFQSAMESGDRRAAIKACGAPCSKASSSLAATPGGGLDYTCNSGNCACAGASDCVKMADICEEDTIGCNDYGCSCKEAQGDD